MKNVTYISAGAGSGKTYTLTTKLASLIAKDKNDPEHVEPEQVILTTFTVKAAAEFKEKAKAELYKMGKFDEAARLDHALMGTIDSVATSLIQKYWYAIGMSPKQGILDDSAKETYINQSIANVPTNEEMAFFAMFRKTFNIVDDMSHPDTLFWKKHLKKIVEKSISFDITDYAESVQESLAIPKALCNGTSIHLDDAQRSDALNALRCEVEKCKDSNTKKSTLEAIDKFLQNGQQSNDIEWCNQFADILGKAPAGAQKTSSDKTLEDTKLKVEDIWGSKEVFDLIEQYVSTIFRIAKKWNTQYADYKLNKRVVDFSDIEHYMHKLLQNKEVAAEIGRTYTHLFVDEFQDCSPIQVKIFATLADLVKQSYWVGDTKQAIYGFRGSDTELTKAVADAIALKKGADGCRSETLEKSWRSVPALVNASNKAFTKIFQPLFGDRTGELVPLKPAMELHPELFPTTLAERAPKPLRYLEIVEKRTRQSSKLRMEDTAQYIKNVIETENANPSDIAVLGRKNDDLNEMAELLGKLHIPCDTETTLDTNSKACRLMMALTTLTVNPHDDLAKAEIAYLTEDDMGIGALIDSKLEFDNLPDDNRKKWLEDIEMVRRVNAIRPRVMYQGIGALIETLAVELDVKNVMERWSTAIEKSMTDVRALIAAAKQYEERSSELSLPATPSGFAAFMEENTVEMPASGDGVKLLTVHKAKGLEWKYVFLLLDETMDAQQILRREIYGINHYHPTPPSAENPYPAMSIRLMPWIFGSKRNVPTSVASKLFASSAYAQAEKRAREESARLLYVGVTRASEVLVLVPWFAKEPFSWFQNSGLTNAGTTSDGDVLGIGVPFDIVCAAYAPDEADGSTPVAREFRKLDYYSPEPSHAGPLTVSPSGLSGKSERVSVVFRSGQRIKIRSSALGDRPYSEVGDCIHNVFAAVEHLDKAEVSALVEAHGMTEVLPEAWEIIQAWEHLQKFLRQQYGPAVKEYHERPFRRMRKDGSVVVGSIDYVYQTPKGSILIDFKTFPQAESVIAPTSPHYAGHYAGQLNAYAEALEAAGENVTAKLIYYPVSGMVVKI